jgi:hypothetical protein
MADFWTTPDVHPIWQSPVGRNVRYLKSHVDVLEGTVAGMGTVKLFDQTLGAGVANVDIPISVATYAGLRILVTARSTTAAAGDTCLIRFNSDSSSIYNTQQLYANLTTITGGEYINAGFGYGCDLPAASATANLFGVQEFRIPNYAGTSHYKAWSSVGYQAWGIGSATHRTWQSVGEWRNTAAITRIWITVGANAFVAGSRFTVYADV